MRITWTDLALEDLKQIESHIAEDNSPVVAIDVVLSIFNTTETPLTIHPGGGRKGRVKGTRDLMAGRYPSVVVYRIKFPESVEILRVIHEAREWM